MKNKNENTDSSLTSPCLKAKGFYAQLDKREPGFYWVYGYCWSENKHWFIAHWDGNYFWYDGDDTNEDSMIEIDEIQIKRNT